MRRYGLLRDAQTHHEVHTFASTKIAEHSDLREYMPPVINQGDIGSCTACSGVALRYALQKIAGKDSPVFSALDLYFWERELDGTLPADAGSALSTTATVGEKIGFAPESDGPYDPTKFNVPPSQKAYQDAANWKIAKAAKLDGLGGILATLSEGLPVHIGILVYPSFESQEAAETGIIPMPSPYESCLGGHAMVAVGHDMEGKYVIVRNSWGEEWGMKGYCHIPFEYFESEFTFMTAWRWAL